MSGLGEVSEGARAILRELSRVVVGYDEELKLVLAALVAGGHVLLEGVPGVAKTTMAKGLARLLGLDGLETTLDGAPFRGWSRVQFTPDLLPSDVTGSLVFNPATREFEPRFGPVFCYLLLADEINRAIPRTQSALLQAMQEREVTIGGRTYRLEDLDRGKFFFVIATQNPVEQEGTYPLPEAQLDRFLMRVIVGYPSSMEVEKEVYRLHLYRATEPVEDLEPMVEPGWAARARVAVAREVRVPEHVLEVAVRLVRLTRPEVYEPISRYFELGASPRAGISLLKAAKAYAALEGRDEVRLEDLEAVAFPVLNHRLLPNTERVVELSVSGRRFTARYEVVKEGLYKALNEAKKS